MFHKVLDKSLRLLARVPGAYPLLAFVTARRVIVRGWSMYPTLAPAERVLFDRLAYRLGPPRRGDVVLASHPARPRLSMVKRVAALPGDAVAIDGDRCWVNGVPFGEESVPETASAPPSSRTLGNDEYLLLGDAPDLSTDARQLGPVGREEIQARAWLVYWPLQRVRLVGDRSQTGGQQ